MPTTTTISGVTRDEAQHANDLINSGRCSDYVRRARQLDVSFYTQGNFTTALVRAFNGVGRPSTRPHVCIGVAKRNCADDAPALQRGRLIALSRALREAGKLDGTATGIIDAPPR